MVQDVIRLDLGFVNAYLLMGKKGPVLVDTGLAMQWEALKHGLEAAGVLPADLALVILTHGDLDHAGNCLHLSRECGVKIAAHAAEAESLESGKAPPRTISGLKRRFLFRVMSIMRNLKGGDTKLPGFKPDILLDEATDLSPWGLDAKLIHLPGHTRGSIALLTKSGGLVVGDVVGNRKAPATSPFVENEAAYRASLEKLKALSKGADTVYPGHGRPFEASALADLAFGS